MAGQPGGSSSPSPRGALVEVAVALPLHDTFTYRDPRGDARLALGSQVVVPFGARRVTGFVVGFPTDSPRAVRDIEDVLDQEPALDAAVLDLCRWAATYYHAPLGEALRAALPQGERGTSARRLILAATGERLLAREDLGVRNFASLGLDEVDRTFLRRLGRTRRGLALAAVEKSPMKARLPRLLADQLVEVGDEISAKVSDRKQLIARAVDPRKPPAASARAQGRTAMFERTLGVDGLPCSHGLLKPAERALLRALVRDGLVRIEERESEPRPAADAAAVSLPTLNQHQAVALEALTAALGNGFSPFVLQGITGSGKTEVYLRIIATARAAGKGALVLVPEIALTPQLAQRFRARFGDDVAVLHSGLAPAQRRAAWRRLRAGEVGIAVGARSAVFAPIRNAGVVVVDEEHDPSFKQDDGVRYNGRDLAVVRAQRSDALLVLGSATPSLESFRNVELGRYRRLLLPTRANPAAAGRPLPSVEVIDLRHYQTGIDGIFSGPLTEAIAATLAAGEQTILFLNRRGFSPLCLCRGCGHIVRCNQCAVSLTYHRGTGALVCHYCARAVTLPDTCPSCRRPQLELLGVGTERVEAIVRERFPTARVARLDRDTAGAGRTAVLEKVLDRVQAGQIDILIGTQMVTKGHDFPGVTLVGVLLPDQGMNMPDFRAAERTFQLLEQVAGRAGRAEKAGRVIIQTYDPDHPAIVCVRTHDYDGFVTGELRRRSEAGYPPVTRMVALRVDGPSEAAVRTAAADAATLARSVPEVRVLGPAEAPISIIRGRTRWQVWLVAADRARLAEAARRGAATPLPPNVRLVVDVDPLSVL